MSDPARWLDGAESPLGRHERDALQALATAGPTGQQRARLVARLERLTGAPPAPAATAWRWSLIAGALAIVIGGANAYMRTAPPSAVSPVVTASPAPPAAPSSEAPAPRAQAPSPSPASPRPEAPRSGRRPAQGARVAVSAASDLAPHDPSAELTLLTPARQLLAVDPARALALADEHGRRFQRGVFREERAFLRIEALVRLGRRTAAERDAQAFLRAHPTSPYQPRLQQLLAAAR